MTLLNDLARAEAAASGERPCPACGHLASMDPGPERDALEAALAGTIGVNTLVDILRQHEIPVGRRAIYRHRKEGHS